MKNFSNFALRLKSKSGIIIIVALWIVVILSILAVGLGRQTSLELALSRYALEKTKATFLSWSGIIYAMNHIKVAEEHPDALGVHTLHQSGYVLPEFMSPEDLFKNVPLGEGYFHIGYSFRDTPLSEQYYCHGFEDESGRLNLNAINQTNYGILKQLIILLGFDLEVAKTISSSLVDWVDSDDEVTNSPYGAENEYYQELPQPYACKNAPLDSVAELLLVRGMTQEIFETIYDYVTVFPREIEGVRINIHAAPAIVLQAVLRAVADQHLSSAQVDADAAVQRIIDYRYGSDRIPCTPYDQEIPLEQPGPIGFNQSELTIFLNARGRGYFADSGQYLRVSSTGHALDSRVSTRIQTVIDREQLTILFWKKH